MTPPVAGALLRAACARRRRVEGGKGEVAVRGVLVERGGGEGGTESRAAPVQTLNNKKQNSHEPWWRAACGGPCRPWTCVPSAWCGPSLLSIVSTPSCARHGHVSLRSRKGRLVDQTPTRKALEEIAACTPNLASHSSPRSRLAASDVRDSTPPLSWRRINCSARPGRVCYDF